jgi:DNA-binding MarR family transcriptional regulator
VNDPNKQLTKETVKRFLQINRHVRQAARQITSYGVRPRDFSILKHIQETGALTIGDIQEYILSSPSTASTVVAKLEGDGYVTRTRSREDNRVVFVELTDDGREIAARTPMQGVPLLRRRLEALPEADLQRINDALSDILRLMEVPDEA